ncbi:MAG: MBL fold metallo-hydrolase [Myxococcota bacterium]
MSTSQMVLLGVAQDAGHPQLGCMRSCCAPAWADPRRRHLPVALGLVGRGGRRFLVEATPALPEQLYRLEQFSPRAASSPLLDGLLLTHAHMGHLIGLAYLGREAAAVRDLPVYLPRGLADALRDALPWRLLLEQGHLRFIPIAAGETLLLGPGLHVEVLSVPHRREIAETVGFIFSGDARRVLFVPDIDAWSAWDRDLEALIASVDLALLDGTFFADGELERDMSEIPHPRVVETMARLSSAPASVRARVRFIHLNHTNPLLDPDSAASAQVRRAGFEIGTAGEALTLG